MLTACLREGKTFHRGEVEHLTRDGEVRRLGVTISPIYRHVAESARARRLRRQCRPRHEDQRRALPDERSDGAHRAPEANPLEGKSRGARRNVRGHRARIQERPGHDFRLRADDPQRKRGTGDIHDSAERILDQTRSLTHVVTEFLRFAKPLEICYETVAMQALVERVAEDVHETFPAVRGRMRGRVSRSARRRGAASPGAFEPHAQRRGIGARRRGQSASRDRLGNHGGTRRTQMAAHLRRRQRPGNPRARFAKNLPARSTPPNPKEPAWALPSCRRSLSSTAAASRPAIARTAAPSFSCGYLCGRSPRPLYSPRKPPASKLEQAIQPGYASQEAKSMRTFLKLSFAAIVIAIAFPVCELVPADRPRSAEASRPRLPGRPIRSSFRFVFAGPEQDHGGRRIAGRNPGSAAGIARGRGPQSARPEEGILQSAQGLHERQYSHFGRHFFRRRVVQCRSGCQ